jgi:EAL domain-containing protein (putative c-di-GMP-specific phosphodiesterase class I)
VLAIISLSHALGLKTVAEGIETAGQLTRLAAQGCDIGQGFFLGRPMSAAAILGYAGAPRALTA